jgi:hypothetical protein
VAKSSCSGSFNPLNSSCRFIHTITFRCNVSTISTSTRHFFTKSTKSTCKNNQILNPNRSVLFNDHGNGSSSPFFTIMNYNACCNLQQNSYVRFVIIRRIGWEGDNTVYIFAIFTLLFKYRVLLIWIFTPSSSNLSIDLLNIFYKKLAKLSPFN